MPPFKWYLPKNWSENSIFTESEVGDFGSKLYWFSFQNVYRWIQCDFVLRAKIYSPSQKFYGPNRKRNCILVVDWNMKWAVQHYTIKVNLSFFFEAFSLFAKIESIKWKTKIRKKQIIFSWSLHATQAQRFRINFVLLRHKSVSKYSWYNELNMRISWIFNLFLFIYGCDSTWNRSNFISYCSIAIFTSIWYKVHIHMQVRVCVCTRTHTHTKAQL